MIQRPVLTEEDVARIGAAAVAEAKKNHWNVSIRSVMRAAIFCG